MMAGIYPSKMPGIEPAQGERVFASPAVFWLSLSGDSYSTANKAAEFNIKQPSNRHRARLSLSSESEQLSRIPDRPRIHIRLGPSLNYEMKLYPHPSASMHSTRGLILQVSLDDLGVFDTSAVPPSYHIAAKPTLRVPTTGAAHLSSATEERWQAARMSFLRGKSNTFTTGVAPCVSEYFTSEYHPVERFSSSVPLLLIASVLFDQTGTANLSFNSPGRRGWAER
ncbi:hypothetical protein IW261DRAFT_997945 [Armillaria novae-zelandiae]|uniref:Uncharacterized protein n=1 Tax=Armillaria novae-zelandiae TaxID=153914 RepID=A0AA39TZ96_9AGAR|nr:hypothetical protein IW261DRAFT_997945 [Armillaria novae-zelandiae]